MDIALASPRRIIRKGLCSLLAQKDSVRVVADTDSAIESFDLIRRSRPEVLLIDCTNPANDLETISKLRILLPETKLVLLIESPNEDFEFRAIKAGARGCIPKEADPQALDRAMQVVGKGEIWASQHLATRLIEQVTHGSGANGAESHALTDREWQILAFVAEGQRNKEIADHLCVSENTVKTHLATIYKKLRVTTRLEAALHFFHASKPNGDLTVARLKRPSETRRPNQRARKS
jgi:two-component system nitrate/nitrite response regulator NarL